jgi:hypothetical protein
VDLTELSWHSQARRLTRAYQTLISSPGIPCRASAGSSAGGK